MKIFAGLLARLRGVRGIEALAVLVAAALLGLALLGGNGLRSQESGTDLERRLSAVLQAIDGAGRVRVMVSEAPAEAVSAFATGQNAEHGRIQGVLVVAEGAGDLRVRLALIRAVQALLDVEQSSIEVVEMRRE